MLSSALRKKPSFLCVSEYLPQPLVQEFLGYVSGAVSVTVPAS